MRIKQALRRLLVTAVLTAGIAALMPAPQAGAVCGGGAPGEPCYCPSEITVAGKRIPTGITC